MFHIGQKVVCVDDSFESGEWDVGRPNLPRANTVYTVRATFIETWSGCAPSPALLLEEVINPVIGWSVGLPTHREIGFSSHRFRPVVEKSTDTGMAILKEILERETVRDPVPTSYQTQLAAYRKLATDMKNR